MSKKNWVGAKTFFEDESKEMKKELDSEALLVDIACQFIKYRAEKKLTQKDMAKKLGMTQAMISKLESGNYNPTVKMLFEIAQKLSWNFKLELDCCPRQENVDNHSDSM